MSYLAQGSFDGLLTLFLYVFLAIFACTAILTLLSLPGVIQIPETYRSKLFAALILEVIGASLGFVATGVSIARRNSKPEIESGSFEGDWAWHYAPRNWRTVSGFKRVSGPKGEKDFYQFSASTYYTRDEHKLVDGKMQNAGVEQLIFTWESEPFPMPKDKSADLSFKCKQTTLKQVADVYGADAPAPGTKELTIVLRPVINWEGTYFEPGNPGGGMFLTRDVKR